MCENLVKDFQNNLNNFVIVSKSILSVYLACAQTKTGTSILGFPAFSSLRSKFGKDNGRSRSEPAISQ